MDLQLFETLRLTLLWGLLGGLEAAIVLLAGHYFPWHWLFGKSMPILWRYVYGVTAVCFIGFPVAVVHLPALAGWQAVAILVIVAAVGGGTVAGCYWFDKRFGPKTDRFSINYEEAYHELKKTGDDDK